MKNGEFANGLIAMLQKPKFMVAIREVAAVFAEVRNHGGRAYVGGNGGCSGIASDFTNSLRSQVTPGMKAYCLNDSMPFITSAADQNEYGRTFQDYLIVEEIGKKDVFVGVSASGNCENVIQAMMEAVRQEAAIVAFVGQKECQVFEQFMRYKRLTMFTALHPDPRGQEIMIKAATDMVAGEMM